MRLTYPSNKINSFVLLLLLFIYSVLLSTCAKNNVFDEPPDRPVIDSIVPSSGVVGTQIRLYGSGFSIHPSADTISINGIKIKVDSPSTSTVLLATVSDSTGTGHVHLKVNNDDVEGPVFTFKQSSPDAPVITGINPTSGWDYTTTSMVIKGLRFGTDQNSVTVNFDNLTGSVQLVKDTQLIVAPPIHSPGFATVTVTVKGKQSNGVQYLYIDPTSPIITKISPDSGWDYTTTSVVLKGSHFGTDQNSVVVKFDNLSASVQSVKDTQIIAAPPTHAAGSVSVTVSVSGKSSNAVQYKYISPTNPAITAIVPDSGWDFTTTSAIIRGSHFGTDQSSVVVKFDNLTASVQSVKDTQLIVAPPTHAAGPATVTVTVKGIVSNGVQYKYVQPGGPGVIEYTGAVLLSEGRSRLAGAGAGNKIVFAGGDNGSGAFSNAVDIYDVSTNTWTTAQLSERREDLAAASAGNKIVFAGGDRGQNSLNNVYSSAVDIYDVVTNTWTTAQLSEARTFLAAAAAGNKIVFAGGDVTGVLTKFSKTVDIYDVVTNTWTTAQLSQARTGCVAAAAGNKIVFAGGASDAFTISNTVDIYDVSTNTWTASQLSQAKNGLAATAAGNKIVFAGGGNGTYSTTADIYDVVTNTWTTAPISEGRIALAAAAAGNKVVFAGGYGQNVSNAVDIYDVSTNVWTTAQISEARYYLAGASTGNKILFAGGNAGFGASKTVDIFTVH